MKAIVYIKYGPPNVFQLKEVEKPTPKDDEILIKVHAASLNYADWAFVRGDPYRRNIATYLCKGRRVAHDTSNKNK